MLYIINGIEINKTIPITRKTTKKVSDSFGKSLGGIKPIRNTENATTKPIDERIQIPTFFPGTWYVLLTLGVCSNFPAMDTCCYLVSNSSKFYRR